MKTDFESAELDSSTNKRTDAFTKHWLRSLSSLRNRNYRWLWTGTLFSINGMQMQMVAGGWLVYTMTNSPLALGMVAAGSGLPILLFSLFGGVLADRVQKRNLILVTQLSVFFMTFIISILIATDLIALWHIVVASIFGGVIFSFGMPARQAFVVELVGKDELLNAIALSSAAMNICRIASPALAGVLIKMIDISGVYWIVVICYGFTILTTMRIPSKGTMALRPNVPFLKEILDGLSYVRNNAIILSLIIISFITIFVAMPYQMLMPVFAKTVFKSGETGLGILMSFVGFGALMGSTVIAQLGDYQHKGRLLLTAGVLYGFFLILFGLSKSMFPAVIWLLFIGCGGSIFFALINTLMMSNTPVHLIGRVTSIFIWTFGLMPLGMLPAGAFAEAFGAPYTVIIGGGILTLFLFGVVVARPGMRRL